MKDDGERSRRGNRGGGSGRGGSDKDKIDALGRLLTRILCHMASELNLNIQSVGSVKVLDLLKLTLKTFANVSLRAHTVDDIKEITSQNYSLYISNGWAAVQVEAEDRGTKGPTRFLLAA
ncbi:hypothetical protein K2173_028099 [Erythroxylum novogranatense]|uniref:2'-phosphotransferase n=1 Tax=Erythroxylum novogranatense TaxID=1862640 RepID=A0AAV8U0X9_9ROSI|nr:hypothetical protein K2173_028099 [Erythroxylum novogranatense]